MYFHRHITLRICRYMLLTQIINVALLDEICDIGHRIGPISIETISK